MNAYTESLENYSSINELIVDIKVSIDLLDKLKAVEIEDIEGACNKINNTANNIIKARFNLRIDEITPDVVSLGIDWLYDDLYKVKKSFCQALEYLSKKYAYAVIEGIEHHGWEYDYYEYKIVAIYASYEKAQEYVDKHLNRWSHDTLKIKPVSFIE